MEKINIFINNSFSVITTDNIKYSYKDLSENSALVANYIPTRSLIFCFCRNTIGSLLGYLSFITNNVVPVMLDIGLDIGLLDELKNKYNPEYVWIPNDYHIPDSNWQKITDILDYSLYRTNTVFTTILHKDLALLLSTSGSTGSPKLVKLTYENIYANASSIAEYLSIDENERPITSLPMYYSFGLSIINSHLLKGATLLLTNNSLIEKDFWTFFKDYKATSISGIPYTFEILKKLRFMNMDSPYLKTITQAGGKLNENLNREFSEFAQKTGKRFFVMYGQTEATARMSYLPSKYSISKLGSMGIAIPGGEFSLIDENGKLITEENKEGELVYKGKNVSMGYAECAEDLAKDDENKGVLITGDMAKRDGDGFYYIVGRKKRFLKLYGNRVNLDEMERMIKNIIPDCACVGTDEKMIIYIMDAQRTNEVRQFVSHKTGINPQGFDVRWIEHITKNASGKTIYSELMNVK